MRQFGYLAVASALLAIGCGGSSPPEKGFSVQTRATLTIENDTDFPTTTGVCDLAIEVVRAHGDEVTYTVKWDDMADSLRRAECRASVMGAHGKTLYELPNLWMYQGEVTGRTSGVSDEELQVSMRARLDCQVKVYREDPPGSSGYRMHIEQEPQISMM